MKERRRAKLQGCSYCIVLEKLSIKMTQVYTEMMDQLVFLKKNNVHQTDKIRKELIKIFQAHGLKLEIKYNFKKTNVQVDITFDLNTGSYSPYRKPRISKNLAGRLMDS